MRYIIVLISLAILRATPVLAQAITDAMNANRAKEIIANNFDSRLKTANYLLYNLDDKYIVIENRTKEYMLFFNKKDVGIEDSISIDKRNRILKKAFDPRSCQIPADTSETVSPHPHSRYIYFFLKDKETMYCEFNLPALFNEDISGKQVYPLNRRVHKFLIGKMFSWWNN